MTAFKTLGQTGYEAYAGQTDNRSLVTGEELPGWDRLDNEIRSAWEVAAMAVAARVRGEDAGQQAHPKSDHA